MVVKNEKIALLGAFCLFLSTIEYLLPKPMPFMRLGLANLPVLLALNESMGVFAVLIFIKVVGQALISGTLFSYIFLFSAAGSLVSAAAMYGLRRILPSKLMSFIGISIAGAFLSNITQLLLARYFILGKGVLYIAPLFLATGIITGAALGLFCEKFCAVSKWYRGNGEQGTEPLKTEAGSSQLKSLRLTLSSFVPATDLFIAGILLSASLLFNPSTAGRAAQCVLFFIIAVVTGKLGKPVYTLIFFAGIVFFNLLAPFGKILYSIGSLRITEGALLGGIRKAATVEGLILLSRVTISPALRLPGNLGKYIGESFALLELIQQNKRRITARNFIKDIDELLLMVSTLALSDIHTNSVRAKSPQRTVKSILILTCAAVIAFIPVFVCLRWRVS